MIDHAAADDFSRLKAITFDLDDTLWDNSGVMQRTEQGHVGEDTTEPTSLYMGDCSYNREGLFS